MRISVEAEKPGRSGLQELAIEADVVFYSKSWAQVLCLFHHRPFQRDEWWLIYSRVKGISQPKSASRNSHR